MAQNSLYKFVGFFLSTIKTISLQTFTFDFLREKLLRAAKSGLIYVWRQFRDTYIKNYHFAK